MESYIKNQVRIIILGVFLIFSLNSFAQSESLPCVITYKQIDTVRLHLFVYKPDCFKESEKYPAIVFFFGGGWNNGSTTQFEVMAKHCASKGMFSVLVDYRVKTTHGTTPFEALKDAKTAIRYLRKNAEGLGIDPQKIVASGGSAGGHLAAACYTNETINESTDPLSISSKPDVLVLFNPVIDNSKDGYGYERIKDKFPEFSPLYNIKKGFPPTIFFLGTNDKLIPVSTAEMFKSKIEAVGSRCDLHLYEGAEHGFFNSQKYRTLLIPVVDEFLESLGYMK
jgi:acetyl esterase